MAVTEPKSIYAIRYARLRFEVEFPEACILPVSKASALRGGMGEMLLRQCCVRDRNCGACDFKDECLVQRILYSKMQIQPAFMTEGDSVGYVLDCEDYREHYEASDRLRFDLTLFGRTIVYFPQILDALFRLGLVGLGKKHGRFDIVSIFNGRNQPILAGADVRMENYLIETVGDYVRYRLSKLRDFSGVIRLEFHTPLTVKYHGEMIQEFAPEAIVAAVVRRIYILDCFEGIEASQEGIYDEAIPRLVISQERQISVQRYSNRKNEKMMLRGIKGDCIWDAVPEELLAPLLAGELVHIGKNTSFGFGRYRVKTTI